MIQTFARTLALAVLLVALPSLSRAADDAKSTWPPLEAAALAERTPVVDPNADAETLVWDVRVEGGLIVPTLSTHYLRVKVFTERGARETGRVDLPYVEGWGKAAPISDIRGRTTAPDGKVSELRPEDVHDTVIVKAGGLKLHAKTFVLPNVVPGCVLEYTWREASPLPLAFFTRLPFQRDIPVRRVTYHIRGVSIPGEEFRLRTLVNHGTSSDFVPEPGGFVATSMTKVPAFRPEPYMPPEDEERVWMLVFPALATNTTPDAFWPEWGRRRFEYERDALEPNGDVRKAAAAAVAGASSDEDRLRKLFDLARTVKNTEDDASGLRLDELERLKANKSPGDTLKRRYGRRLDVNRLFVALATSAGFDARIALVADRGTTFFDPKLTGPFLTTHLVAIRVGGAWRFFDPGSPGVPFGGLHWQHEGQSALVTGATDSAFVRTPLSTTDASCATRTATLRLDGEGTLEGDVRIEYTGHSADDEREAVDAMSATERETSVRDAWTARFAGATVSDVVYADVDDASKPLVLTFRLRAPGYAQRTGQRLFVRPSVFTFGERAAFDGASRLHPIYFHYPWSERDRVTIALPENTTVEPIEAIASLPSGMTASYAAAARSSEDGRSLVYERTFAFGGSEKILFDRGAYGSLKSLFDTIRERDATLVSLTH